MQGSPAPLLPPSAKGEAAGPQWVPGGVGPRGSPCFDTSQRRGFVPGWAGAGTHRRSHAGPVPSSPEGQEPGPFAGSGGAKNALGDLFTGGGQRFVGRAVQPFLLPLRNEHFLFGHVFSRAPRKPRELLTA